MSDNRRTYRAQGAECACGSWCGGSDAGVSGCLRAVFAERFDTTVLAERARRTNRLEEIVHHLGLAMGGRPGAGFAQRLMLPVSNDTLLRVVRRRALPRTEKLAVIGIDDWAYRRSHRYGTIICDLERRRVVALLPDREHATAETWLRQHPGISIVSRDRGGGYGEAIARAPGRRPDQQPVAQPAPLCQRCHMLHGRPHHLAQCWITYRRRYALGDLFLETYESSHNIIAGRSGRHWLSASGMVW